MEMPFIAIPRRHYVTAGTMVPGRLWRDQGLLSCVPSAAKAMAIAIPNGKAEAVPCKTKLSPRPICPIDASLGSSGRSLAAAFGPTGREQLGRVSWRCADVGCITRNAYKGAVLHIQTCARVCRPQSFVCGRFFRAEDQHRLGP